METVRGDLHDIPPEIISIIFSFCVNSPEKLSKLREVDSQFYCAVIYFSQIFEKEDDGNFIVMAGSHIQYYWNMELRVIPVYMCWDTMYRIHNKLKNMKIIFCGGKKLLHIYEVDDEIEIYKFDNSPIIKICNNRCDVCNINYYDNEKHCCKCINKYYTRRHCCKCKMNIVGNSKHCCKCSINYNKGKSHCCRCEFNHSKREYCYEKKTTRKIIASNW